MTAKLTIGKLARAAGVGVDTVRYYERIGLMPSPARSTGGYRLYGKKDLDHLRFIRNAQKLGFTLAEIKRLLTWMAENSDRSRVRELADRRLEEIDQQLADLQTHRDTLTRLFEACSGSGPLSGCPIIEAVIHPPSREQTS
ncbi:MerR family transcriptional regulator [Wenzhouxiangella sp. AB-CW3]|uniref:MerR family transcriptional regulator n=1 Tax=Wenzhouxiangella sp. AB-CW3 TaxID=2771012 RepID=UPI001CC283C4|nr:MerR family transcriptional regulator [Wenzhouxiangella sp. AB-CW3]